MNQIDDSFDGSDLTITPLPGERYNGQAVRLEYRHCVPVAAAPSSVDPVRRRAAFSTAAAYIYESCG